MKILRSLLATAAQRCPTFGSQAGIDFGEASHGLAPVALQVQMVSRVPLEVGIEFRYPAIEIFAPVFRRIKRLDNKFGGDLQATESLPIPAPYFKQIAINITKPETALTQRTRFLLPSESGMTLLFLWQIFSILLSLPYAIQIFRRTRCP